MDEATRIWDVTCEPCELTVGHLAGGRFWHDDGCQLPLRIEAGAMVCCRCGGSLTARERPGLRRELLVADDSLVHLAAARKTRP